MMRFLNKLPGLQSSSGELLHLDALRFIAAAGIIFSHSKEFFVPAGERAARNAASTDFFLFVDLFFVISGFIIAHVYRDRMHSLTDYGIFLQRRVGRLVPLHWLTLAVYMAVWAVFSLRGYSGAHAPSFSPVCIADTALLLHSFIDCGGIAFNGASWSISAEMICYLLFPVVAVAGMKNKRLLLTGILSAIFLVTAFMNDPDWTSLQPVTRALLSFTFGSALFYNRLWMLKISMPAHKLVWSLTLLVTCMTLGVPQRIIILLVYMTAIMCIASDLQGKASLFVRKLAPLGLLSYSLYMWHSLWIMVIMNAVGDKWLHAGFPVMVMLAVLSYMGVLATSYISYLCIETPLRRRVDGVQLLGYENSRRRQMAESVPRDSLAAFILPEPVNETPL